MNAPGAVVLLSGGLDSATVLALAVERGFSCHALSFDYGQRHRVEIEAASRIADALGATTHRVLALDIGAFGGSALTDGSIEVPESGGDGIPLCPGTQHRVAVLRARPCRVGRRA